MRTYLAASIAVALALAVAACADESMPGPQGRGGAGAEGGLSEGGDNPGREAKPAPKVEKGVLPDLIGASLEDSEKAIKKAGFKGGELEGGIGAGNVFPSTILVCEQDPEPGATPKGGTAVDMVLALECPG